MFIYFFLSAELSFLASYFGTEIEILSNAVLYWRINTKGKLSFLKNIKSVTDLGTPLATPFIQNCSYNNTATLNTVNANIFTTFTLFNPNNIKDIKLKICPKNTKFLNWKLHNKWCLEVKVFLLPLITNLRREVELLCKIIRAVNDSAKKNRINFESWILIHKM